MECFFNNPLFYIENKSINLYNMFVIIIKEIKNMEYLEGNFKLSKKKANEILENMEISKEKIKQKNKNKKI